MRCRFLVAAALLVAVASLSAAPAAGQTRDGAPEGWTAPRTPWGDPDLQGQWNSQTSTPLERPLEGRLAETDDLSPEEAQAIEDAARAAFDLPPREGSVGNYNAFWRDVGTALTRTSLIVDPPDGRIPPLSAEGEARIAAERAERSRRGPATSPDTYSDLSQWTRCISRGWNGIGSWYSSNYQIFQVPGYVVVYQELIHEPRIIPLDGRPHVHQSIRQWLGDSRGHWEGDTLVVETTNFTPKTNFRGSRDTLHLTGALHAPRRRHHRLPVHDRRSADLPAAVDGRAADEPDHRPRVDLRVRVPRGELRHGGHPGRRAGRGTGALTLTRCASCITIEYRGRHDQKTMGRDR